MSDDIDVDNFSDRLTGGETWFVRDDELDAWLLTYTAGWMFGLSQHYNVITQVSAVFNQFSR